MAKNRTLEVAVSGMDCAQCSRHVEGAISKLPGVESVNVLLSSEKAVIRFDPTFVDLGAIRKAVEGAGYSIPDSPLSLPPHHLRVSPAV